MQYQQINGGQILTPNQVKAQLAPNMLWDFNVEPPQAVLDNLGIRAYVPVVPALTLAELKALKNAEIDAAREAANESHFFHNGIRVACDALSFKDISSTAGHIALFGQFPPKFPGAWKGKDEDGNTAYIPLPTIEDFKAFFNSMSDQGATNFEKSQALKARLAAATKKEQIDAITWE